jgi:hypothetical protein
VRIKGTPVVCEVCQPWLIDNDGRTGWIAVTKPRASSCTARALRWVKKGATGARAVPCNRVGAEFVERERQVIQLQPGCAICRRRDRARVSAPTGAETAACCGRRARTDRATRSGRKESPMTVAGPASAPRAGRIRRSRLFALTRGAIDRATRSKSFEKGFMAAGLMAALAAFAIATPRAVASPPPLPQPVGAHMHWYRWHPSSRALQGRAAGFGSNVVLGLASMHDLARVRVEYGLKDVRPIPALHAVEVPVDGAGLRALLARAPVDRRIRYVSPPGPVRHPMSLPSDPLVQSTDPHTVFPTSGSSPPPESITPSSCHRAPRR